MKPQGKRDYRSFSAIAAVLLFVFTSVPSLLFGQSAVPLINQPLVPDAVAPGGAGFVLIVNGTGFADTATVNWNGNALVTTYVSSSLLEASVPAANIAAPGTASITVVNPPLGGGTSNTVFLPVRTAVPTSTFANAPSTPVGVVVCPERFAVGDFDHNGTVDLAVSNYCSNSVTILMGNGDGSFASPQTVPAGIRPYSIAVGDFNEDGFQDLAVGNTGGDNLTILLGDGSGNFTASASSPSTGTYPQSVATGDFNGDGNLDLAVANEGSNTLTILLGNGDGTFTASPSSPGTGTAPYDIAVGDFDSDGNLDLAVANYQSSTLTILLGNGNGTFSAGTSPATAGEPTSVVAADLNGDGILDLAVLSYVDTDLTTLIGDGQGGFTASGTSAATLTSPYSLAVGDFNGDGNLDFAVGYNYPYTNATILLGDGAGGVTGAAISPATGTTPFAVAIADFNGDGRLDLATANYGGNTISILLQQPPAPLADLSSTSLTFPAQVINTTSSAKPVVITNSGSAAMTITNIQTTGDFSQTNDCGGGNLPAIVAVGEYCTVNVTFTPTTAGSAFGTLTFTDDSSSGTTQLVSLSGTGLSAGVPSPSAPSVDFGSVPVGTTSSVQTVTITNNGSGTLGITSISVTDPTAATLGLASQFNRTGSGTCTAPSSLAAGASCTVDLTFSPVLLDVSNGVLSIMHDGANSPLTISLAGTGAAVPFARGDVFLGVTPGLVQRRDQTGKLIQVLDAQTGFETTGMAFDPSGNLLVTEFTSSTVVKFDGSGNLIGTFGSGFANPECIVFDSAGNVYISNVGLGGIRKYDANGNYVTTILSGTRVDWMDLAADEKTMLYTDEGTAIHSVDVSTGVANPDFATGLGGAAYALRFLRDGGVLVANALNILRLDSSGNTVKTYVPNPVNPTPNVFALNLDPDGTSFWTADYNNAHVYKIDIATGNTLLDYNADTSEVAGLTVKGEITAANSPELSLSATSLTMPDTPLNLDCPPRVLTLTNTGTGALSISSITSNDNTLFTISGNTCPVGSASLAAGGSCQVSVTFHPTVEGTVTGSLTIASNAPGSPHTVSLAGTGKPPCPLASAQATQQVLRGTDRTTFTVEPDVTCQGTDEIALACVNAEPASCAFNPGTIQNPEKSLLTVANLRAVGGSGKQFQVTGTSADAIQRTLYLQVLFSDFSFTAYPTQATVAAGDAASYALSVVPVNGLDGRVSLTCAGAPAGGSCTVIPSSVTVANNAPVQVQVKVQTSSRAGIVPMIGPGIWNIPTGSGPAPGPRTLLLGALAGLLFGGGLLMKRRVPVLWPRLAMGAAMLLAVTMWGSCGGGGTTAPVGSSGSTAGTYSIVVTGTFTPAASTTMVSDSTTPTLQRHTTLTLRVK